MSDDTTVRIPINASTEAMMARQYERGLKFNGLEEAHVTQVVIQGIDGAPLTGGWGRPPFIGIATCTIRKEAAA